MSSLLITLHDWWARGSFMEVEGHRIFTAVQGSGPTLVFLHGFPTSSYDWAAVIEDLSQDFRCVTFDYLGFGASDKPRDANYSSVLQTGRALEILRRLRVERAAVIRHDLGGILLQQMLLRAQDGAPELDIEQAVFSNSSVYPQLYRPTPAQLALTDPTQGPLIAARIGRATLEASLATMFPSRPLTADSVGEL